MMAEATQGALVLLASYLLGSLPFSYWIVLRSRGVDVRTIGSGNPGATNVLRAAGKGAAVLALLLDVAKGAGGVVFARWAAPSDSWVGWAALAAVSGHVFSLFLGFRGGKGVATAVGALAALSPSAIAAAGLVFVITVALSRFVSLGSILGAVTFPVAVAAVARGQGLSTYDRHMLASSGLIAALIVVRHHANLRRLLAGTENRLGGSKGST